MNETENVLSRYPIFMAKLSSLDKIRIRLQKDTKCIKMLKDLVGLDVILYLHSSLRAHLMKHATKLFHAVFEVLPALLTCIGPYEHATL